VLSSASSQQVVYIRHRNLNAKAEGCLLRYLIHLKFQPRSQELCDKLTIFSVSNFSSWRETGTIRSTN